MLAGMDEREATERRRSGRGGGRPGRQLPVRFASASGAWTSATTRNIGVDGAFVETATSPAVGTTLTLELTLAARTYALDATVRWCGDGGIGVQFVAVEIDVQLELSAYFDDAAASGLRPR